MHEAQVRSVNQLIRKRKLLRYIDVQPLHVGPLHTVNNKQVKLFKTLYNPQPLNNIRYHGEGRHRPLIMP